MFSRRTILAGTGALALSPTLRAAPAGETFSWPSLQARALDQARRPYRPPTPPAASASTVSYDTLNHIAYRPDRTLWGDGGRAGIRFFPLSAGAAQPVTITVMEDGRTRPWRFDRALFQGAEHLPAGLDGFSGFRVMNRTGESDWLAFQGASYFRAAGALDQFGLSARALAIDTGLDTAEEFPRFTDFWLEAGPGDATTVYALLDSPSASGAWRFVNRRTSAGVEQEVTATVMLRREVRRLGLAPLTSMFWYGEGDRAKATDWRPEIHDSDGLAMLTGAGERIWRPLATPSAPLTNSFVDRDPRGFGLLQRDRAFDHYQDDGVFYDRRPDLWVEPQGRWGPGAVNLFAIPTTGETADNIVAFWTPAGPARAGRRYDLSYRLRWTATEPMPSALAHVVDCWRGTAGRPGDTPIAGATRLVADFIGPAFTGLDRASGVEPVVTVAHATILSATAYPVVGVKDRWRLVVDLAPKAGDPADLRAYLRHGRSALTETLLYQFA